MIQTGGNDVKKEKFSVSANEIEFFAEDAPVEIIPHFQSNAIRFFCGTYGPFRPQRALEVPLWLALALKKQLQCTIVCPEWMRPAHLKALKHREKNTPADELQKVPFHYMEIAALLLQYAASDLEKGLRSHDGGSRDETVDEIRSLLEDVQNIRAHKIRQGLQAVGEQQIINPLPCIELKEISAMEIQSIRGLLVSTLGEFHTLHQVESELYEDKAKLLAPGQRVVTEGPTNLRNRQQAFPPSAVTEEDDLVAEKQIAQEEDEPAGPARRQLRRFR